MVLLMRLSIGTGKHVERKKISWPGAFVIRDDSVVTAGQSTAIIVARSGYVSANEASGKTVPERLGPVTIIGVDGGKIPAPPEHPVGCQCPEPATGLCAGSKG